MGPIQNRPTAAGPVIKSVDVGCVTMPLANPYQIKVGERSSGCANRCSMGQTAGSEAARTDLGVSYWTMRDLVFADAIPTVKSYGGEWPREQFHPVVCVIRGSGFRLLDALLTRERGPIWRKPAARI